MVPPDKAFGSAVCVHVKDELSPSGSDEFAAVTVNSPPSVTMETAELATATGTPLPVPPPPLLGRGVGVDVEPPQDTRSEAPNKQATETREMKGMNNLPQVVIYIFSMIYGLRVNTTTHLKLNFKTQFFRLTPDVQKKAKSPSTL